MAKFIRNVLPGELRRMKTKFRWPDMPRVILHDKAPYMVSPAHERLQVRFAAALQEAGFMSWVGDSDAQTGWMVRKWGDVYPHETLIAHIRRLLDQEFVASKLSETPAQFKHGSRTT